MKQFSLILKSKFRIEDKLKFPWYYTIFSKYDQSFFFAGFQATATDSPSF